MREIGTFFAGAILALSLTLPGAAMAQQQNCSLKEAASLDLTLTPSGGITVPVRSRARTIASF